MDYRRKRHGWGGREKRVLKSILFHQGHDYHPPGNLDAGENLVKQIYNSLISNRKAWEKTLLLITFDEPIGSFDDYPPPAAIPPRVKGKAPGLKRQYNFSFDRYGGRVPTILVSPLVEKITVFRSTTSVPFDHTSIIATILKWRGLENKDFGERTKQAPTFDNIVSLSTPRKDEKEVRFLKVSHKLGEPVRFYDRFNLRDATGKYISGFREHAVFPGSFFSEDPTFSEYFPIQAIENPIEMKPGGILVAGKWRTQDEVNKASADGIRNTLIVELSGHTNQPGGYFQGKKDVELVGIGAVVVFLLRAGIRDRAALTTMSDDDQRKALIVENNRRYTDRTIPQLQAMTNQELVQMGLQWFSASQFYLQNANNRPDSGNVIGTEVRLVATDDGLGSYNVLGAWKDSRDCYYFNDYMEGDNAKRETWIVSKVNPFTIEMTPGGILVAGKWRTQDQVNKAKAEDIRNTLIVELSKRSIRPGGYFQGKNNDELVGFGAMVVFLLKFEIRPDTWLKQNTDDDHRNILIYVLTAWTQRPDLQGMSNQKLVQLGLEWFAKSNFRFGDKVFLQNKYFDGQRLAADGLHHGYLTTNKSDAYWTIEPILGA